MGKICGVYIIGINEIMIVFFFYIDIDTFLN